MLLHRSGLNYYKDQLNKARHNGIYSYHDEDLAEFQKAMQDFHEDLETIKDELVREEEVLPAMYERTLGDHLIGSEAIELVEDHIEEEKGLVNQLEGLLRNIVEITPEKESDNDMSRYSEKAKALFGHAIELLEELNTLCRQTGDELQKHIRQLEAFKDSIHKIEDKESTFAKNLKSWIGEDESTAGSTRV